MRYFITGSAGFIGFHLASRLLRDGHQVFGFDGLTDYYDVRLKRARHAMLERSKGFSPIVGRLEDLDLLKSSMRTASPDVVVHLAAQAGVRYSLDHPETYLSSNIVGTFNLLEVLKTMPVRHAVLASSSSIYGANDSPAFAETDRTDFPLSIYAATKRAVEAMAHSYAHLFAIPITLTRFFTVYGPWGRPDMAPIRFATAIVSGTPLQIYGHGDQSRDFTYIDDVVEAIVRLAATPPVAATPISPHDSVSPVAPWRTVNVAGSQPISLVQFVAAFERALGRDAIKQLMPMQPGDVRATRADVGLLRALTGFVPQTPLGVGVGLFCDWFRSHYVGTYG